MFKEGDEEERAERGEDTALNSQAERESQFCLCGAVM